MDGYTDHNSVEQIHIEQKIIIQLHSGQLTPKEQEETSLQDVDKEIQNCINNTEYKINTEEIHLETTDHKLEVYDTSKLQSAFEYNVPSFGGPLIYSCYQISR